MPGGLQKCPRLPGGTAQNFAVRRFPLLGGCSMKVVAATLVVLCGGVLAMARAENQPQDPSLDTPRASQAEAPATSPLRSEIHKTMSDLFEAQSAEHPDQQRIDTLTKQLQELRAKLRGQTAAGSNDSAVVGPGLGRGAGRGFGWGAVGKGPGRGMGRGAAGQGAGRGPGSGRGCGWGCGNGPGCGGRGRICRCGQRWRLR